MDRKKFLKTIPLIGIGGAGLIGCSTGSGVGSEGSGDLSGDNLILTQAAEREAIAIQTYNAAAQSGIITDQGVLDTAVAYRDHHVEHLELFNDLLLAGDGEQVVLSEFGADSRINNVTDQEEAVVLAMTLEMEAANSYFTSSIRDLQGPTAREIMGSIFPIEVSHFVTLKAALGRNPAINAAVFSDLSFNN
jgi:rubrerythrin